MGTAVKKRPRQEEWMEYIWQAWMDMRFEKHSSISRERICTIKGEAQKW